MPFFGWFVTGFLFLFAFFALTVKGDMGVVALFVAAGLLCGGIALYYFQIRTWLAGGIAIRLLQHGIAISARYTGTKGTGIRVQGNYLREVRFKYNVDGKRYTVSARVFDYDISRLTDTKYKMVLYDPMKPTQSVVWNGLPRGIHFDEPMGQFWVNPLRCVLPLLAASIVCGQVVAFVVFVIRAI